MTTPTLYTCLCAMLVFSWSEIYAAAVKKNTAAKTPAAPTTQTVACPQINATHEFGRIFTQNGRRWHTYIKQGDQLQINTANDSNYATDPTPAAKDVIGCQSGPDKDPHYAFEAWEPKGLDCTVQDKTSFLCQPASTTKTKSKTTGT